MSGKTSAKKVFIDDNISTGRLLIAGVVGLILGLFGIHDFFVKRYAEGVAHLLLCIIAVAVSPIAMFAAAAHPGSDPRIITNIVAYLPLLIATFSHVWGVVESIRFIVIADKRQRAALKANSPAPTQTNSPADVNSHSPFLKSETVSVQESPARPSRSSRTTLTKVLCSMGIAVILDVAIAIKTIIEVKTSNYGGSAAGTMQALPISIFIQAAVPAIFYLAGAILSNNIESRKTSISLTLLNVFAMCLTPFLVTAVVFAFISQ